MATPGYVQPVPALKGCLAGYCYLVVSRAAVTFTRSVSQPGAATKPRLMGVRRGFRMWVARLSTWPVRVSQRGRC